MNRALGTGADIGALACQLRTGSALLLHKWLAIFGLALILIGCASQNIAPREDADQWSGRLSFQVEGQESQSFSALFELQGNEESGELKLMSPLGNQLAELAWRAGYAHLITSHGTQTATSLDSLLQAVTGSFIPVAAMLSWLQGKHAATPGWNADLSAWDQGRITASRTQSLPHASLRIALTR